MDPDSNLEEQLKLADSLLETLDGVEELEDGGTDDEGMTRDDLIDEVLSDSGRLAELVASLDGWICKGGFLPKAWRRG